MFRTHQTRLVKVSLSAIAWGFINRDKAKIREISSAETERPK